MTTRHVVSIFFNCVLILFGALHNRIGCFGVAHRVVQNARLISAHARVDALLVTSIGGEPIGVAI